MTRKLDPADPDAALPPAPITTSSIALTCILLAMGGHLDGPPEDVDDLAQFTIAGAPSNALARIDSDPILKGIVKWFPQVAALVREAKFARRRAR